MNAVMEFLLTRRSRPAKLLGGPGPDRPTVERILQAGARVPDHGKLEPWRFLVLEPPALARVATAVRERAVELGEDADKAALPFEEAPLTIMEIGVPRPTAKIPAIEQTLSAGCVALSVLNAALASGWGANWLSGWAARDTVLVREAFGLSGAEWVVGFVHVGTCRVEVPDRPRPNMAAITTWASA
jgi:nitroreductase